MYVKLFGQILDSSIWLESGDTRLVWITLLAAMDADGFARFAAVENLARRANVSLKACEKAVQTLESPDPRSSDPANEGKRIERVPGGWMVLNAEKYRELGSDINRREKTAERTRQWRERLADKRETLGRDATVTPRDATVTKSDAMQKQKQKQKQKKIQKQNLEVESKDPVMGVEVGGLQGGETDLCEPAPTKPGAIRTGAKKLDGDLIGRLKANPAYEGIDLDRELAKAVGWCEVNRRSCTPRFFVNWLNRVELPMKGNEGNGKIIQDNRPKLESKSQRAERERKEFFGSVRNACDANPRIGLISGVPDDSVR